MVSNHFIIIIRDLNIFSKYIFGLHTFSDRKDDDEKTEGKRMNE